MVIKTIEELFEIVVAAQMYVSQRLDNLEETYKMDTEEYEQLDECYNSLDDAGAVLYMMTEDFKALEVKRGS